MGRPYNVDNSKVQYLGEGDTKVETFVVKSVDGTEPVSKTPLRDHEAAAELEWSLRGE
ncbi:VCBS domain-containing protein, partial [Aeromonas hydrophila]